MYNKTKIEIIDDIDEMNKLLTICKKYRFKTSEGMPIKGIPSKCLYWVREGRTKISVFGSIIGKYAQHDFYLDGRMATLTKSAMECFSLLQRMSGKAVIDLTNTEFYDGTDEKGKVHWNCGYNVGLLYTNEKFIRTRTEHVYSYDRNSSFSWGMLQDMPDTSTPPKRNVIPNENEIGMSNVCNAIQNRDLLEIIEDANELGIVCEYVFPRMPSPFKHFVEFYYNKKVNAKSKEERQKYKEILNYAVGFIRRKNPFLHSAIISYSNAYIRELINGNTIYCNTDSIVSTKPRKLDIGEDVGQFKIEHNDESFAINESGYQWNYEIPSIRGMSKQWFINGFDLLNDLLPTKEYNKYIYDSENEKIILNENYEV